MKTRGIVDEDFINYKKPAMFISAISCTFKCCHDANIPESVCQNSTIVDSPIIDIPADEILRRYVDNPITEAIIVAGLEPMLQFEEVIELLEKLRAVSSDDFVIYTGYDLDEVENQTKKLARYANVVVKFGRYVPNQPSVYDDVLGVELASYNQYAMRIS